jgi:molybdenum-dependent DNA-binding transcriptional regulator ModE
MQNEVVTKHAGGRPVIFGIDNPCWFEICKQISEGKSLSTALKSDGMPSYRSALMMLQTNLEFRTMYEKAIESRADRLAEEILELADEAMPAHLEGAMASAWVQQKRLQVDTRKWVAAKLKPKVYGDRIDVSVTDTRISVSDALKEAKQRVLTDESNIVDVAVKEMANNEVGKE